VRTSSLASGKTSAVRVVTRLHAPDGTSTVRNVATVSGGGGGPTSDVLSASAVVQVSGTLAFTGSDVARLAALAAALLVAGAGSLVITRRRRHG
jgi:LPXTG-motif cell wall-anchored protein